MQWFKKWWQEKYGNPSNDESFRGGNKCKKGTSSEQSNNESKSRLTLSRESICEVNDKNVSSSSNCSSSPSSSHASVQSTNSIESYPIACRIRQQAKDLESLITGSVSSGRSIDVEHVENNQDIAAASSGSTLSELLEPDEFFEDPEVIRAYKEKNAFIDEYIIIDIKEVEAITHLSKQNFSVINKKSKPSPKPIKYKTTEFSIKPAKKKSQTSSLYSMESYCNDGYGLFYGTPTFSLSQFPESFSYRTFHDDSTYGRHYKGRTKRRYKSADGLCPETLTSSLKLNSSSELLEEKVDAFEKSLMGPLINELPKPCASVKDKFSIQKTFGLTDDGDIIVNVDHIIEEKGCGFLFARKISIYRSVEQGDAICEKRRISRSLVAILKEFFYQLCKFKLTD